MEARLEVCDYFPCAVSKQSGRNCADYEDCQTFKFLERYGLEYLSIGCGAPMIDPTVLRKYENSNI